MARLGLCLVVVLAVAGCDGGDDAAPRSGLASARARVDELSDDLRRARAEIADLEDEARRGDAEKDVRFVDMYGGGPTLRGAVVALPRLGVLRWSCDGNPRRFRLTFQASAATVGVAYDTGTASERRTLHPGRSLSATADPGQEVWWTVTHRHKPGFIRARAVVVPRRTRQGSCLLGEIRMQESAHLFE